MSDNEPTADKPTAEQPTPAPEAAQAQVEPARPRLRDHLFGLRSVVAVALAGVVLGGLGGFAVHAATDGGGRDDRDDRLGRFGPGGFQGGPGGFPQGPGQRSPGQQGPGQQAPQPSETPSQDS